jgi:transposase InsO family protein
LASVGEDARNVGVKNLTFTEVIPSRAVKDVLPALARIYARLRYLGLPLRRIHCDRARELTSASIRRWTLDRGVITTLTTGSTYKTNGRVESEVGAMKRAVRMLISAKLCPLESWPLALRHAGESQRRLRSQLQGVGWPVAPLLKFGVKAFALKKSWKVLDG